MALKAPKKKVNAEKNQIDFISSADRAPLEWNQYDNSKRTTDSFRSTEREKRMLAAAAKKVADELGVSVSKQDYIIRSLRAALIKDLNLDPNDLK